MKRVLALVIVLAMALPIAVLPVSAAGAEDLFEFFYSVVPYQPASRQTVMRMLCGSPTMEAVPLSGIELLNPYDLPQEEADALRELCENGDLETDYDGFVDLMYTLYTFPDQAALSPMINYAMSDKNINFNLDSRIDATGIDDLYFFVKDRQYSFYYFMSLLKTASELYYQKTGSELIRVDASFQLSFATDAETVLGGASGELFYRPDPSGMLQWLDFLDEFFTVANGSDSERNRFIMLLDSLFIDVSRSYGDDEEGGDASLVDRAQYDALRAELAQNGKIAAASFADPAEVVSQYVPRLESNGGSTFDKKLVEEALCLAATVPFTSKTDFVEINDQMVNFAQMNAQLTREQFAEENISVLSDVKLYMGFTLDYAAFPSARNRIQLNFDTGALKMFGNLQISGFKVILDDISVVCGFDALKAAGLLDSSEFKVKLQYLPVSGADSYVKTQAVGAGYVWQVEVSGDSGLITRNFSLSEVRVEIPASTVKKLDAGADVTVNAIYSLSETASSSKLVDKDQYLYDSTFEKLVFPKDANSYFAYLPDGVTTGGGSPGSGENTDGTGNSADNSKPGSTGGTVSGGGTTATTPAASWGFSDVPDSHWAKNFIEKLVGENILSGMGNNMFAPDSNITREQFVRIIVDALGVKNADAKCEFSDVPEDAWYHVYVASAVGANLINGIGGGMFGSGSNITRQDMAVILKRAADAEGSNLTVSPTNEALSFGDESAIADYAKESVSLFSRAGIINGFEDATFRPTESATRAQAAKMVYLLLHGEQ